MRRLRLQKTLPGFPGAYYDELRRRGLTGQAIRANARKLWPVRGTYLIANRFCSYVRWADDFAGVVDAVKKAPAGVHVFEPATVERAAPAGAGGAK